MVSFCSITNQSFLTKVIKMMSFKVNVKNQGMPSQSFHVIQNSFQLPSGGWNSRNPGKRSIHIVWRDACWRLSIVSNCFQMLCTLNYCIFWHWFVILLVNLGASYYFSSAKSPPNASLVSKSISKTLGWDFLLFCYKKSFSNYWKRLCADNPTILWNTN